MQSDSRGGIKTKGFATAPLIVLSAALYLSTIGAVNLTQSASSAMGDSKPMESAVNRLAAVSILVVCTNGISPAADSHQRDNTRGNCEYKNTEKGYKSCDPLITKEECYKRYGQGDGGYVVVDWTIHRNCSY